MITDEQKERFVEVKARFESLPDPNAVGLEKFFHHLSPSNINLYVESPAKWALCYLHKFKEVSPAMWRGSAVEAGIIDYLLNRDLDVAIKVAFGRFEKDAQGEITDAIEKQLDMIPGMVEQGSIALAGHEAPCAVQVPVEHRFDDIPIPVIGFVDAEWPQRLLEIKTVSSIKNEITAAHACQSGFYSFCRKKPIDVLYVTPKKFNLIALEDPLKHVQRLERAALAIQILLTAFPDAHDATRILPPPDYGHNYLWKSEAAREAYMEIENA
jgi:hypothetical protein